MPEFTHQWSKQNPDCGPLISTIAHSETVGVVTSLSRMEYSWQSRQSTQHSELSSSRHCRLAIRTCQRPRLPQEGTSLISHIRLRCHLLSLRCSVNSVDERSIQAKRDPCCSLVSFRFCLQRIESRSNCVESLQRRKVPDGTEIRAWFLETLVCSVHLYG